MIIVRIMGGIGNQIFQYSFAKNLSIKLNKELYFDNTFYSHPSITNRKFLLHNLNLKEQIISKEILTTFHSSKYKVINEEYFTINTDLPVHLNYYFDGYWQSEKYFSENENQIFSNFFYDSEQIKLYSKIIEGFRTVSLHIRRGDYVGMPDHYVNLGIEYYKNALDLIGTYDKILLFSDDVKWCKENLNFDNIIFVEDTTDLDDLILMSRCTNNIIANSSFSWWGARLNKNPDKRVIAPSKWYGPKMNVVTKDLLPENWIKI